MFGAVGTFGVVETFGTVGTLGTAGTPGTLGAAEGVFAIGGITVPGFWKLTSCFAGSRAGSLAGAGSRAGSLAAGGGTAGIFFGAGIFSPVVGGGPITPGAPGVVVIGAPWPQELPTQLLTQLVPPSQQL